MGGGGGQGGEVSMMQEHEILATSTGVEAEYQEPSATAGRNNRLATSRQRTYTAELMKAHVALMERGVILSKEVDLFRLVRRHYSTLHSWHDQKTRWRIPRSATVILLARQVRR